MAYFSINHRSLAALATFGLFLSAVWRFVVRFSGNTEEYLAR